MNEAIRYEDYAPLLNRTAGRYLRRAHGAGARSLTLQDIVSEMGVAFCIARNSYDPARGVPFAPYLMNGVRMHLNAWFRHELSATGLAISLDAPVKEGDHGVSMLDLLEDEAPSPEDEVVEKNLMQAVLERASPRAAMFLRLLSEPPLELVEQVRARQARSVYARERGLTSVAPRGLTADLIFALMGVARSERTKITSEIRTLAGVVSK